MKSVPKENRKNINETGKKKRQGKKQHQSQELTFWKRKSNKEKKNTNKIKQ